MFSKIFIERPRFAIVIAIVMTLAGAISLFSLPIALYPQITPPEINISASYTGASAEVVANSIGIPIEQEVNGVEDMLYMSSSSSNSGMYSLSISFETGAIPEASFMLLHGLCETFTPFFFIISISLSLNHTL